MKHAKQYLDKNDQTKRSAECPDGHGVTTLYLGVVQIGNSRQWEFRCAKDNHITHLFRALPDRSAPQTLDESIEWVKAQKAARVYAESGKAKGKG